MWTSSSSSTSSAVSSTSLSSSTSSSPSPYAATNFRLPKTMEEVWKDISLAASDLHHHPSSRGMILQDFFSKDPPPTSVPSPGFSASPPPPPPQPPIMLTLSSGPDRFGPLLFPPHHQIQPMSQVSSISAEFDALVPGGNAGGGKKRCPDIDRSSGDRRHRRMIKNRESAARSRARKQASILFTFKSQILGFLLFISKNLIFLEIIFSVWFLQAYTNELELEVANLLEENAKLREHQQQVGECVSVENLEVLPILRL